MNDNLTVKDIVENNHIFTERLNSIEWCIRKINGLNSSDWLDHSKKDERAGVKILVNEYEVELKNYNEFLNRKIQQV